jgi:hypothetical protein
MFEKPHRNPNRHENQMLILFTTFQCLRQSVSWGFSQLRDHENKFNYIK